MQCQLDALLARSTTNTAGERGGWGGRDHAGGAMLLKEIEFNHIKNTPKQLRY